MPSVVDIASSWLFVPGDRPDRMRKALASAADVVICDLEDAVSADHKDQARTNVVSLLASGARAVVRVNAVDTPWWGPDISAVAGAPGVLGMMVPKAESPSALSELAARLPSVAVIVPLVESAAGLDNVMGLTAVQGVGRLAFGSVDYALDLGCAHEREPLLHARSLLVHASRRSGLPAPVDGVTQQLRAPALVVDDTAYARRLGFTGKLCIHPEQVELVNTGFAPSPEELNWARTVLASDSSAGATSVDGWMVDAPVRSRAELIVCQGQRSPAVARPPLPPVPREERL